MGVIEPFYPQGKLGRPPMGIEKTDGRDAAHIPHLGPTVECYSEVP